MALTITACNNAGNSEKNTEAEIEVVDTSVEVIDNHTTASAVDAYLELKDALVESNVENSTEAASAFKEELSTLAESDSLIAVMMLASDSLSMSADINVQRSAFEIISDNFYLYLKASGNGRPLYRQYCPMAFNNKGAYWISDRETVMNPYFGDAMLKCGRVDEEL